MSTNTPHPRTDRSADYEATGTAILADYTVAEMRRSVARLKQVLRAAFPPETAARPDGRQD
jgi:hypothetical protein